MDQHGCYALRFNEAAHARDLSIGHLIILVSNDTECLTAGDIASN